MHRLRCLVAVVSVIGCVAGCTAGGDDATPSSEPTLEPTLDNRTVPALGTVASGRDAAAQPGESTSDTLPLVDDHAYPTAPDAVVLQVSVDDRGLAVPLLTVYGNLEAIARTADGWRSGSITSFQVQDLLDEADSVGLLGDQLELRGPDLDAPPDITVGVVADGFDVAHQFDLSQIERPPALRVVLSRWASSNPLGLDDPFDPSAWVTCTEASSDESEARCRVVDQQATADDRPLLPHEPDAAALLP